MKILVTGQSGVGKTTILRSLNKSNVYYADDFVKEILYQKPSLVFDYIKQKYPQAIVDNYVDTSKLGPLILPYPNKLAKINKFIAPFVREWIEKLPNDSIIEMAGYLNTQQYYKDLFDQIIVVKRKKYELDKKFNYLKTKVQPISNVKIKSNYTIKNNGYITDSILRLKNILHKIDKKRVH